MRGVEVPTELIGGDVDEGYGRVAEAFRRNFVERGEVGAACTVYRDGRKVVDLWGGFRDGEARTRLVDGACRHPGPDGDHPCLLARCGCVERRTGRTDDP
jgi:hypothetical protein